MPITKTSKEEIIAEALRVFRKKGYYNTSMSDLAAQCGLQKGSFYHYFPSKEILMAEILKNVNSYLNVKVFSIAFEDQIAPKERMEKMLIKLGKVLLSQEGGCIAGNTTLETAGQNTIFKAILKNIFTDWTNAMKHIFIAVYSENTAQRLAEQAVMEFEGAVMFSLLFDSDQYLKDVFTRTLSKFK